MPAPLFATPYSLLATVSRPAHHRRHEVLDRRRADLLHHGVSFGTEQFQHPLDAGLAEGAKTPDIGPTDADRVRADAQCLDDVGTATEAAVDDHRDAAFHGVEDLR